MGHKRKRTELQCTRQGGMEAGEREPGREKTGSLCTSGREQQLGTIHQSLNVFAKQQEV